VGEGEDFGAVGGGDGTHAGTVFCAEEVDGCGEEGEVGGAVAWDAEA